MKPKPLVALKNLTVPVFMAIFLSNRHRIYRKAECQARSSFEIEKEYRRSATAQNKVRQQDRWPINSAELCFPQGGASSILESRNIHLARDANLRTRNRQPAAAIRKMPDFSTCGK
jgi:hypothetical protein